MLPVLPGARAQLRTLDSRVQLKARPRTVLVANQTCRPQAHVKPRVELCRSQTSQRLTNHRSQDAISWSPRKRRSQWTTTWCCNSRPHPRQRRVRDRVCPPRPCRQCSTWAQLPSTSAARTLAAMPQIQGLCSHRRLEWDPPPQCSSQILRRLHNLSDSPCRLLLEDQDQSIPDR